MYQAARVGRLFVCLWAKAEMSDLDLLINDLRHMKAEAGRIHFVSLLSQSTPVPDSKVRQAMIRRIRGDVMALVDRTLVLIEGESILARLNRTVVRGMMVMVNQRVPVVSSVEQLIVLLGNDAGESAAAIHAAIEKARTRLVAHAAV